MPSQRHVAEALSIREILQELASFRYELRKFLRFSERAARECGITPQQHQLMLGVAGFTSEGSANVSQLAEFLQERHNSVVGLIERAVQRGLVRREADPEDRRIVVVSLTRKGEDILSKLSYLHYEELQRVRAGLPSTLPAKPRRHAKGTRPFAYSRTEETHAG
jgi:DNA-binding MarR family transcriptional regulator